MEKVNQQAVNNCLVEIKKGDRESVNKLYELVAPSIRYIALQYADNSFDADDLVQDFWRDIFRIAEKFINIRNGYAFLCRVMQRRALNYYKKNKARKKKNVGFIDYSLIAYDANVDFALVELKTAVEKAIAYLDENEKIVIQLSYFMNLTVRDIAAKLGLPKSNVGRLKISAENKLREKLSYLTRDK